MKAFVAFTSVLAVAYAAALAPRQSPKYGLLDLEQACRDADGYSDQQRTIMVTFSMSGSIEDALKGEFGIKDGDYLVHTFNGACHHISTAELEPQSPGFKAEIDVGLSWATVEVDCFEIASGNGDGSQYVGKISVELHDFTVNPGLNPVAILSHGQKVVVKSVSMYAYRTTGIIYPQ